MNNCTPKRKQQTDQVAAEQDAKEHEKDLLRDLIDQQLLLQKAQELGITADTELVKRLDELRKQMHADSMEDLEKAAQAQGISFEDFKQNMKNNILTQRVIGQEVGGHITVTQSGDSAVLRPAQDRDGASRTGAAERNPDLHADHAAGQERQGRDARCRKRPAPKSSPRRRPRPTRFTRCCRKATSSTISPRSTPTVRPLPSVATWNTSRRGTLSKDLETQVFALKAGDYTEPIRTNQGFVILKVTEHQSGGVPPLKEVENQIQEQLYMTKMQPALRDYLTKLREDAYIDIKPGYLDTGASPNETQPIYTTASTDNSNPSKEKKKKKLGIF